MVNSLRIDCIYDTHHLYTSVKIRWRDKISVIWKYDQTKKLGWFTDLLQCCCRHTVPGKGGVVVASDCNGFDVGVAFGNFVTGERIIVLL